MNLLLGENKYDTALHQSVPEYCGYCSDAYRVSADAKVGGREILLTLALVGLGVYIVMMLAQRYPQMVNLRLLPRKETIADIRSGRVLRPRRRSDNPVVNSAKRDLAAQLNLLICLIFSFGANSTLSVAAGKIQTLNVWFIWAILALMLICIGVALFRIYRR